MDNPRVIKNGHLDRLDHLAPARGARGATVPGSFPGVFRVPLGISCPELRRFPYVKWDLGDGQTGEKIPGAMIFSGDSMSKKFQGFFGGRVMKFLAGIVGYSHGMVGKNRSRLVFSYGVPTSTYIFWQSKLAMEHVKMARPWKFHR